MSGPPLGAHVSIAGGINRAIERGETLNCDALQIFVKNPNQWAARPLTPEACRAFRDAHEESRIEPLVAHSSYLINLAATDPGNIERSRKALADELDRCEALGITGLVAHPGAHLGTGVESGLERVTRSLDAVFDQLPDCPVRVLLEITAGQGTVLGHRLEHLAAVIESSVYPDRIGVCIDTCHAFAAGYALDVAAGYADFFGHLDEVIGPDRLACFHLNDSRGVFGSRRDRHANLGEGEIGTELFARLVHDRRWRSLPMILETPRGDDGKGHEGDLELLRSL